MSMLLEDANVGEVCDCVDDDRSENSFWQVADKRQQVSQGKRHEN
jgi:hypothetical protein